MTRSTSSTRIFFITIFFSISSLLFLAGNAQAHCDTTGGPIIPEARAALEKKDVTPILKWVEKNDEAEIRAAFAKTVAVRGKGKEVKELADQYFLETLVRVHRAGEGAPYSGSVEAGREFVEAYVTYMHYVEGIHAAIASSAGHHQTAPASAADAHKH